MANTSHAARKQAPVAIPINEPVSFDAQFYQIHYLRALRFGMVLLLLNIVLLVGAYYLFKKHVPADVYAITLTGKLIPLEEAEAPSSPAETQSSQ